MATCCRGGCGSCDIPCLGGTNPARGRDRPVSRLPVVDQGGVGDASQIPEICPRCRAARCGSHRVPDRTARGQARSPPVRCPPVGRVRAGGARRGPRGDALEVLAGTVRVAASGPHDGAPGCRRRRGLDGFGARALRPDASSSTRSGRRGCRGRGGRLVRDDRDLARALQRRRRRSVLPPGELSRDCAACCAAWSTGGVGPPSTSGSAAAQPSRFLPPSRCPS